MTTTDPRPRRRPTPTRRLVCVPAAVLLGLLAVASGTAPASAVSPGSTPGCTFPGPR